MKPYRLALKSIAINTIVCCRLRCHKRLVTYYERNAKDCL